MKALTILTEDFKHELESLNTNLNLQHCHKKSLFIAKGTFDPVALVCLLEHIVILTHPVYGHSPKLVDMALELRTTEVHKANIEELISYLKENNVIHLEGYATFRMADYRNKLDIMMYCLIKKMNLHQI